MAYRFMPELITGPSHGHPIAPIWTIHLHFPGGDDGGLRLKTEPVFGCCADPMSLTRGDVIDDHLAAWMRGKGRGGVLEELAGVCQVDGQDGCEIVARAREEAAQPDWRDRLHIEVNSTGVVTRTFDQHVAVALRDLARDWREVATVRLPVHPEPVPYRQVWPGAGRPGRR